MSKPVNSPNAGGLAQQGVSNAMSQDYIEQGAAAGLQGTTPGQKEQPWYSKLIKGPQMDKATYQTGLRDQTQNKRLDNQDIEAKRRFDQQDKRIADQLGISVDTLNEMKAQHQADNEARKTEQASTDKYRKGEQDYRQNELNYQLIDLLGRNAFRDREFDPNANLELKSKLHLQQTQADENVARASSYSPQAAAQKEDALMRMQYGDAGYEAFKSFLRSTIPQVPGATKTTTGQPINNSDSVDFHGTGTQSVPGSFPGQPHNRDVNDTLNQPQTSAYPSPNPTQSVSPIDALNARERANTAAGTSSQMGQSQQMGPTSYNDVPQPPITQEQPLEQAVGESGFPSDALALTRPAQTPNSPTGILPSSAANFMPPFNFDPQTLKQAAMLARLLGMPQGTGGMPGAGGSGGMPTGYG